MTPCVEPRHGNRKAGVLTEGGLKRTLKSGRPDQTMHLWWTGAMAAPDLDRPGSSGGDPGATEKFLIEIELVKVEGDRATLRIWAPDEVQIISANKDPHCRNSKGRTAAGWECPSS